MKAISLWQPWASLVAVKAKQIETRSWATSYRGQLAIHAARRPMDEDGLALLESLPGFVLTLMFHGRKVDLSPGALPLGAVVATGRLVSCQAMGETTPEVLRFIERRRLDEIEVRAGHYASGRFAWFLRDVQVVEPACAARGRQGLWEWNEAEHTGQPKLI